MSEHRINVTRKSREPQELQPPGVGIYLGLTPAEIDRHNREAGKRSLKHGFINPGGGMHGTPPQGKNLMGPYFKKRGWLLP
jgi:hypothetical protein